MQIAVFGAGSGLGFEIAKYCASKGVAVFAIGRTATQNAQLNDFCKGVYDCDATDKAAVKGIIETLPNSVAIISTMGNCSATISVDYIGHRHLIDLLESSDFLNKDISRFILITSLGCGDSWQYLSPQAKQVFGAAVREKSLAEAWLKTSSLKFTIIRPGGLKNSEITESGRLTQNQEVHGLISRQEMARITYSLIDSTDSINQTYECVDLSFC